MRLKQIAVATTLLIVLPSSVRAQTIPERVSAGGGKPVELLSHVDARPVPLGELARDAALIVIGHLSRPHSYLTSDEYHILTDYRVEVTRIIVDHGGVFTLAAPGFTPSITVTVYGGELEIAGTPVKLVDLSQATLRQGVPLLLFLKRRSGQRDKFEIIKGASGVFEVSGQELLKSLRRVGPKDAAVEGRSVSEVIPEIAAAAKRR